MKKYIQIGVIWSVLYGIIARKGIWKIYEKYDAPAGVLIFSTFFGLLVGVFVWPLSLIQAIRAVIENKKES